MYFRNLRTRRVRAKLRSWAPSPTADFRCPGTSGSLCDLPTLGGVMFRSLSPPRTESTETTVPCPNYFTLYNRSSKYFVFYYVAKNSLFVRTCVRNIVYVTDSKRGVGEGAALADVSKRESLLKRRIAKSERRKGTLRPTNRLRLVANC